MSEKNLGGARDAVCIQTKQIYDSCKSKECLENLRVYVTEAAQCIIDTAINVKVRKAEIIWVFSDVEPVPFNKGFYTVDLKYFFKVTLDVYTGPSTPRRVSGLAMYDKKIVLFGSEGNARIFSSKYREDGLDIQMWQKTNMPEAVVEVVDPIALAAKVVDTCDECCKCDCEVDFAKVPASVQKVFDGALVLSGDEKRVFVSLGIFTMVKLERNVQLLIPSYDFCIPDKECVASTEENPCDLFETLNFPVDEFFPPTKCNFNTDGENGCDCGCRE